MGRLISVFLVLLLVTTMVSCNKSAKEDLGPFKKQPDKQVFSYDEELPPPPDETPATDPLTGLPAESPPVVDPMMGQLPPPPETAGVKPDAILTGTTDEHVLRIDFAGECWVKVVGPNDDIFAGLMKDGDTKSWGPEKYFIVTLGKPEVATIYFDRQQLYGGDQPHINKLKFALPVDAEKFIPVPEEKPEPVITPAPAAAPVSKPAPATGTPARPASADGYMLRIDITEECWVEVHDGEDVIYQALMQAGDSKSIGPRKSFDLVLGKPKNASVYLDDRKIYGEGAGYPKTLAFTVPGGIDVESIKPSPAPSTPAPVPAPATAQPAPTPTATEPEPVAEPESADMGKYYGWIETGQWALAMDEYDNAIASFEAAYAIEPNYAQVNMLLGKAHHAKGSYSTAIDYLNKALSLNPSDEDSLLEMARTQEDRGDPTKAIEYYEKYLIQNDRDDIREHVKELKG
jgi:hypothetical protein